MMEGNNFILMHFINTIKIALADLEVFLFLRILGNKIELSANIILSTVVPNNDHLPQYLNILMFNT